MDLEVERPAVIVELDRCACENCDRAEDELRRLCERFGAVLRVRNVEIEPWLKNLAGWKTPLVYLNGQQLSQASIMPNKWEKALREKAADSAFEVAGEIIDVECHLKDEARGERHVQCALECLERGEPVGLLTPNEQVFLLFAGERDHERLVKAAGKEVTVRGRIFRKGGVQAIVVDEVL